MSSKGFQCIASNTPSLDREDSNNLENHHIFFKGGKDRLLIEFIDASKISAGSYLADIAFYPIDSDSSPCTLKLKKIVSSKIVQKSSIILSDEEQKEYEKVLDLEWKDL